MKPKKPSLVDRIFEALREHGELETYELARLLWPPDHRLWRYASQGGPPAWSLVLGRAIWRADYKGAPEILVTRFDFKTCRRLVSISQGRK